MLLLSKFKKPFFVPEIAFLIRLRYNIFINSLLIYAIYDLWGSIANLSLNSGMRD